MGDRQILTIEEFGADYCPVFCCGEKFIQEDVAAVGLSIFCGF
jgi:hypothetical protein